MTTAPPPTTESNTTGLAAVVVAAGAGSRLGHRPKSLLELDGVPLIVRLIDALQAANVAPIVVVLGYYAEAISGALGGAAVTQVLNPTPDDGQGVSVQIGLRALEGRERGVIVALADQPLMGTPEIAALMAAFEQRGAAHLVLPRVNGQPGNPVMIDAALRTLWLSAEASTVGKRWRQAHPLLVHAFDSENENYRIDIDTPEDMARFAERTGRQLRWPT